MYDDRLVSSEDLEAEIVWLESVLDEDEDWRALRQLDAREAEGEILTAIDAPSLKALLVATLTASRLYARRMALLAELERRASNAPASVISAVQNQDCDDFCRVRRITPGVARRLHALDVSTFEQIANWTSADVQYMSRTLRLGRRISTENWIEQAALLARSRPRQAPVATSAPQKSADAPAAVIEIATLPEPAFTGVVPGPLPAWRYEVPERTHLSVAEALAILGLPAEFGASDGAPAPLAEADLPYPPVPLPAWRYAGIVDAVEEVEPAHVEPAPVEVARVEPAFVDAAPVETEIEMPRLAPHPAPSFISVLDAWQRAKNPPFRVQPPAQHTASVDVTNAPPAPEARVTIGRGFEALKPAHSHVRAEHAEPANEGAGQPLKPFDRETYAAYRERMEEASVEIVRPIRKPPAALPPDLPVTAPVKPKMHTKRPATAMNRFFRALTGEE